MELFCVLFKYSSLSGCIVHFIIFEQEYSKRYIQIIGIIQFLHPWIYIESGSFFHDLFRFHLHRLHFHLRFYFHFEHCRLSVRFRCRLSTTCVLFGVRFIVRNHVVLYNWSACKFRSVKRVSGWLLFKASVALFVFNQVCCSPCNLYMKKNSRIETEIWKIS